MDFTNIIIFDFIDNYIDLQSNDGSGFNETIKITQKEVEGGY